ncbi:MAG: sugar phosphate isomerase/epimerase [Clostridium perfringens]|nr:sugar phosphate isomerase/epimerase [Clostridium perfringens]
MEIGISSACFYPDMVLEDSISIMKNLGFNTGELFINTVSECNEDYILKVKEETIKNKFNIRSVHFFSAMYEPFLFDNYKRRRKDALNLYRKVCKATNLLGASMYTFHGMRYRDYKDIDKKLVLDVYNELLYIAGENNIELAQENVSWCMSCDLQFLKMIKEEVKQSIKYTFDIKQSYKANENPLDYLDIMGKDLVNFHINDRSENSSCMLPGEGNVDYNIIFNKLREINYDKIAIIEVYRDNFKKYEELSMVHDFLRKF